MLKTPREVLPVLQKYTTRRWAEHVCETSAAWPHKVPLGKVTEADPWPTTRKLIQEWTEWARDVDAQLVWATRRIHGTRQQVPTHLIIPDLTMAQRLLPKGDAAVVTAGIARLPQIRKRTDPTPALVRAVAGLGDVDTDLLMQVADWVRGNDTQGLTPRQVPVPGVHAKFLSQHRGLVQALSGKGDLGLMEAHRRHAILRYLDPNHLAGGGREFDLHTEGDPSVPEYLPSTVVICENKDTARAFPSFFGGLAIEGGGFAGAATLPTIPWLPSVANVCYWGDIDAAGFEIVNAIRGAGVPIRTILMGLTTFEEYARYGSSTDRRGKPLGPCAAQELPNLTPEEREVYELLCSDRWGGYRRIEQERIPAEAALPHVLGAEPGVAA